MRSAGIRAWMGHKAAIGIIEEKLAALDDVPSL